MSEREKEDANEEKQRMDVSSLASDVLVAVACYSQRLTIILIQVFCKLNS